MPRKPNRREFLQTSALAGVGIWTGSRAKAAKKESPNDRIRFACIGVEGKGSSDSRDAGRHGEVVAICDIDEKRLDKAAQRFPDAKRYFDWRKLLDEMGEQIDAVTVSTPDHSHAVASLAAMRMGKHCFTQKPMTHTLQEARLMGQVAREYNSITMMGNQGTAGGGLRKAAALTQSGTLGTVTEAHVWTNRPVWHRDGAPSGEPTEKPEHVNWDLWLGPAKYRPYAEGFHPFEWRGWWDFGTGALGDMACHTLNMPFMALDLRDPVSVQAQSPGHDMVSYPKSSIITFEFPATDKRPAVTLTWYEGGELPPAELLDGEQPSESGALLIGDKAKLYSPGDYGQRFSLLGDVDEPEVEYVRSPGHFQEWVRALKGGEPAVSNFPDYAGPLTETILLGNLAVWASAEGGEGKKIEWDAKNQVATNAPEVEHVIRKEYREGYSI